MLQQDYWRNMRSNAYNELFDMIERLRTDKLNEDEVAALQKEFDEAILKRHCLNTYNMEIEELGLNMRSLNCLKNSGIQTVADLQKMTPDNILRIRNLGRKSMDDILNAMDKMGIRFVDKNGNPKMV